jgi:hypothetical protein
MKIYDWNIDNYWWILLENDNLFTLIKVLMSLFWIENYIIRFNFSNSTLIQISLTKDRLK